MCVCVCVLQEHRRKLLQEMCTNDSIVFPGKNRSFDDIPNKELDHLIVDDRHGIIYCYVPKVRRAPPPVFLLCVDASDPIRAEALWFYTNSTELLFLPGSLLWFSPVLPAALRWRAATGSGS